MPGENQSIRLKNGSCEVEVVASSGHNLETIIEMAHEAMREMKKPGADTDLSEVMQDI